MKSKQNYEIQEIKLISENGIFSFREKHNVPDPVQTMLEFESCNWEQLGTIKYQVILRFDDGVIIDEEFKGVNASADLCEFLNYEN